MGVQHRFGTAGATGGGWSAQPGTLQPSYSELGHNFRWQWQARGPTTKRDKVGWRSKWSFGCKVGYGDVSGADGSSGAGYDMALADYYNPPVMLDGGQSLKFIKGMCVDTSDAPLSGANLQAFRTSDNTYAGYVVQSREDGSYDLATNFPGVNHFVVAYLAGSPDRTTATLNTLQPTNIDGT